MFHVNQFKRLKEKKGLDKLTTMMYINSDEGRLTRNGEVALGFNRLNKVINTTSKQPHHRRVRLGQIKVINTPNIYLDKTLNT